MLIPKGKRNSWRPEGSYDGHQSLHPMSIVVWTIIAAAIEPTVSWPAHHGGGASLNALSASWSLSKVIGRSLLTLRELEEVLLDVKMTMTVTNRPLFYQDEEFEKPVLTPNTQILKWGEVVRNRETCKFAYPRGGHVICILGPRGRDVFLLGIVCTFYWM